MNVNKITIFLSLLVLITVSASAQSVQMNPNPVQYGKDITVTTDTANTVFTVEGCKTSSTIDTGFIATDTFTFNIPKDLPCGLGTHGIDVYPADQTETQKIGYDTIEVNEKNMDPNKGKYMYVRMDYSDNQFYNMILSNDVWPHIEPDDPEFTGQVGIEEVDNLFSPGATNEKCVFLAGSIDDDSAIFPNPEDFYQQPIENMDCEAAVESLSDLNNDHPYDVQTQSFTNIDSGKNMVPPNQGGLDDLSEWNLNSYTPIHKEGLYKPDGDLIHGYEPDTGNKKDVDGSGPMWFICRDSMMDNRLGHEVDQVVNNSLDKQKLYKCNGNEWEMTYECSDGLDNDGDGEIDESNTMPGVSTDDGCENQQDDEASGPDLVDPCDPRIAKDSDTKYAYFDSGQGEYNPNKNNCNYEREKASNGLATGQPTTDTCKKNSGSIDGKLEDFCQQIQDKTSKFHPQSNTVNAVKYYVPAEAIPTTKQAPSVASKYVKNTDKTILPSETRRKCIRNNKGGFVNTRCETLHMAETEYRNNQDPHTATTWQNKNMTNLQGYTNDNPNNYQNAWITGNAAVNNNQITGFPDTQLHVENNSVFSGGFAGNCPTGQRWSYVTDSQRWECSGLLQWSFDYFIPDLDAEGGTVTTGIFLNPGVFYNDENTIELNPDQAPNNSFALAWEDQNSESASIEKVHYGCYPGDPYISSTSGENVEINSVDVGGESFSNTVFLPYDLGVSTAAEYGCNFRFEIETPNGRQNLTSSAGATEITDADIAAETFGINDYLDLSTSYDVLANASEAEQSLPPTFP